MRRVALLLGLLGKVLLNSQWITPKLPKKGTRRYLGRCREMSRWLRGSIELGERVWVADPARRDGRTFGRIASLTPDLLNDSLSFVVVLDGGKPIAVTCCEDRRGGQWDFAEEGQSFNRAT
jgi:hypothetical protein